MLGLAGVVPTEAPRHSIRLQPFRNDGATGEESSGSHIAVGKVRWPCFREAQGRGAIEANLSGDAAKGTKASPRRPSRPLCTRADDDGLLGRTRAKAREGVWGQDFQLTLERSWGFGPLGGVQEGQGRRWSGLTCRCRGGRGRRTRFRLAGGGEGCSFGLGGALLSWGWS